MRVKPHIFSHLFVKLIHFSGGVDAAGADKMWNHAPASCDSEVSRETKKGVDYIVVKKSFTYRGDNSAQTLGAASIYLDDASTVTVEGKTLYILNIIIFHIKYNLCLILTRIF